MQHILSNARISITELNPTAVINAANGEPVAVLVNNKPSAYLVPAATFRALLERLDNLELGELAHARAMGAQNQGHAGTTIRKSAPSARIPISTVAATPAACSPCYTTTISSTDARRFCISANRTPAPCRCTSRWDTAFAAISVSGRCGGCRYERQRAGQSAAFPDLRCQLQTRLIPRVGRQEPES